jgi:hypothetical protein
MDIAVITAMELVDFFNHSDGLLGGGAIVKINQPAPIDLLAKHWKIPPDFFDI